jgi:general secretion pathway protein M
MNELRQWFESLAQRERALVSVAAVVVCIGIIYFAVWLPIDNSLASAEKKLSAKEKSLLWMEQSVAKVLVSSSSGQTSRSSSPLITIVNTSGRAKGFKFSKVLPKDDNEITLLIDEVKFDDFIIWLDNLESQHRISVEYLRVNQLDKIGYVKANFKLVR